MKFSEYKLLSTRTNKWLLSSQFDLAHALIGMTSELNELQDAMASGDFVNRSEELSDIAWYLSLYVNVRDIELADSTYGQIGGTFSNLIRYVSLLTDLAKKWIIYNKEIPQEIEKEYCQILLNILANFDNGECDFETGLQNNIDKLKKRYPEKYSDELAQNRDLLAERKELEK